ncbi:MAG: hypothetical protein ACYC6Y_16785, partial [Thermoguttaceae bacterium]
MLPFNPTRAAHRCTVAATRPGWPLFRRAVQHTRERFISWGENERDHSHSDHDSNTDLDPDPSHPRPAADPSAPKAPPDPTDSGLLAWGQKFLPDHFLKPPSEMHLWMAGRLDRMAKDRGERLNVLGPRGGAKSTVATLAYPLREALLNREPYIWILSDTMHQAHAHLENLKAELLDNPLIARRYPRAAGRGPVWQAGRIILRNGVTIEAFGTGQRIRGRRARANR